ncbi:hypothetical protein [Flavihumibacter fluvii]|uniref:hypothetical protein n=1 Tax=Flavihumibacter fluvii TaxID=2838157 RepID=UPI001BDDE581|nr:hypothetical protein [Flavihumibacter fluvii]ULQ51366.1 hypothetical protein KJS93_14855 [Flavihumibacter fluvii]
MSIILHEYSTKLMNKILVSSSHEEVKRHIHSIKKTLEEKNVSGHAISGFFENIIADLESLSPMHKNAQEWSNIQIARIFLHRTKNEIIIPQ